MEYGKWIKIYMMKLDILWYVINGLSSVIGRTIEGTWTPNWVKIFAIRMGLGYWWFQCEYIFLLFINDYSILLFDVFVSRCVHRQGYIFQVRLHMQKGLNGPKLSQDIWN